MIYIIDIRGFRLARSSFSSSIRYFSSVLALVKVAEKTHAKLPFRRDGKSFFPGMQSFFPKSAFYCIFLHLTSIYLHRAAFAFCITSHSITSGNIFQAHMRQNADPTSCHINTTFDMSHWFAFTRIILHVSRKHSITLLDVNIHLDLYCIQQHFVRVHPI